MAAKYSSSTVVVAKQIGGNEILKALQVSFLGSKSRSTAL
jgi:hypothetical protein